MHPYFKKVTLPAFIILLAFSSLPLWLMGQTNLQTDTNQIPATKSAEPAEEEVHQPSLLAKFNKVIFTWLFFDISGGIIKIEEVDREGNQVIGDDGSVKQKVIEIPFLVIFLLLGGIFFSIFFKFISLKGFKHSTDVIAGKFDKPDDPGEISHFRALTSALSATVGLGNIAGVAVAIQLGGPGAVFWMWVTAFFGMAAKFSSCTLSQLYRKVNADGSISGGPMYYLDLGLKEKGAGWGVFGKVLAVMFAFMVMGGALGGGNMFQANQTVEAITNTFDMNTHMKLSEEEHAALLTKHQMHQAIIESISEVVDGSVHVNLDHLKEDQKVALGEVLAELKDRASKKAQWGIGIAMAIFAGIVILGGIRRIGATTSRIVPMMCGLYILASLYIIFKHIDALPSTFALIFKMAFTDNAFYGGMVGVLIWGIKRAGFSNEAGLGSAAIAHAAAKTNEPVREGMVAMIGPFIDTIVICTMTALVVIITGAWADPSIPQSAGVSLTTQAFERGIEWFPFVLTGCIALFAYSTMISWCYYGERGWIYLMDHFNGIGIKTVVIFRIIFVACIIVGATNKFSDVLDFSDAMILSMAFPNIIGSIFLAPIVLAKLKDYWGRYTAGEMKPVK